MAGSVTSFPLFTMQVAHTKREILDTLLNGLKRLEYRGYDSAGVSIDIPMMARCLLSVC